MRWHYACAILWRDGLILLGRRAAHRKAYPLCWDVIGGRVEAAETVAQALRRELGEELAITPLQWETLGSLVDDGPQERGEAVYHMHRVDAWDGGEPSMANDEHSELRWFTVAEACALSDLALGAYREVFRQVSAVNPSTAAARSS